MLLAFATVNGEGKVGFGAAWDMDHQSLTCDLLRDGAKVRSISLTSAFWSLPKATFVDIGLVPGSTHVYHIKISDPVGNTR